MGLLAALGRTTVAVVGHDFGAWVASWCALLRPDVFRSVVLMSAPFAGPPAIDAVCDAAGGSGARRARGAGPAAQALAMYYGNPSGE